MASILKTQAIRKKSNAKDTTCILNVQTDDQQVLALVLKFKILYINNIYKYYKYYIYIIYVIILYIMLYNNIDNIIYNNIYYYYLYIILYINKCCLVRALKSVVTKKPQ